MGLSLIGVFNRNNGESLLRSFYVIKGPQDIPGLTRMVKIAQYDGRVNIVRKRILMQTPEPSKIEE